MLDLSYLETIERFSYLGREKQRHRSVAQWCAFVFADVKAGFPHDASQIKVALIVIYDIYFSAGHQIY